MLVEAADIQNQTRSAGVLLGHFEEAIQMIGTPRRLDNPIRQQTLHPGENGRAGHMVRPGKPKRRDTFLVPRPSEPMRHDIASPTLGPSLLPSQKAALPKTVKTDALESWAPRF